MLRMKLTAATLVVLGALLFGSMVAYAGWSWNAKVDIGGTKVSTSWSVTDDTNGACDPGKAYLFSSRTYTITDPAEAEFGRFPALDDDLVGYCVLFGDVVGDGNQDLIIGSLSNTRVPAVMVWDGEGLVGQTGTTSFPSHRYYPRPGVGAHFMGGMTSANLLGSSKSELVLGDFDYSLPGLARVGRVVVVCFR